jgi:hypothetical protein
MPVVPRIRRTEPIGHVTRTADPIPVVLTLHWHTGEDSQVDGWAVAWTSSSVEVRWDFQGSPRTDWVAVGDVGRVETVSRRRG